MTINEKYSIVTSVIAVAIVGVIALFYSGIFDKKDITSDLAKESQIVCNYENDQIAYQEAINNVNFDACSCITRSELKNNCEKVVYDLDMYNKAISQHDSNLCNEIVNESKKGACLLAIRNSEPTLEQAILLAQKGSFTFEEKDYGEKSLVYLKNILEKDPNNLNALLGIGYSYEIMENYDNALVYYNKALDLDSRNASVYNRIGHMYDLSEGLEKAKPFYQKALELDPYFVDPKLNLARAYYREGEIDKAQRYFEEIYSNEAINNRTKAEIGYVLSMISVGKGENEKGKTYIEDSVKNDPSLPIAWVGLGQVRFMDTQNAKSLEEAESILNDSLRYIEKAISIYKNQTMAYIGKGRILYAVGKQKEANDVFKLAKNVLDKDITLMKDEREVLRGIVDSFISETSGVSSVLNTLTEEVLADNSWEYQHWMNAVITQLGGNAPGHVWTFNGNTATCANGNTMTFQPYVAPNVPDPVTCTYKDFVTEWSDCDGGSQVAISWTTKTKNGTNCTDVPLTRLCSICGNSVCEAGETSNSCIGDCTGAVPVCNNSICEGGENSVTCPADCSGICGNKICESGENVSVCDLDCATCGDAVCSSVVGENEATCQNDCTPTCGNGLCGLNEATSCPLDCAPVCGDSTCETNRGENFLNCSVDCSIDFREI